jgi:hypothetical protein
MIQRAMTLLAHRGEGPAFSYAGQPMHILAGQSGQPRGFAAMELAVPPHFAGPIPHAHDGFDEAIYVLSGRLLVVGEDEPRRRSRDRCSWRSAVTGTASAIPSGKRPRCWDCGPRQSPPLPSCEKSVPRSRRTPRQTRTTCARFLRPARQPPPALISRRLRCLPSQSTRQRPICGTCGRRPGRCQVRTQPERGQAACCTLWE